MKLALTSAAAIAAALVAVAPASASTYVLNGGASINVLPRSFAPTQCFQGTTGNTCELTDTVAAGSSYTSLYEFTLGQALTLTGSNFANSLGGVAFNSVVLYTNGLGGAFGTTGASRAYLLSTNGTNSRAELTPDMVLTAGNYTVAVTATVNQPTTTVTSNFSFAAAPAPEPATWGLMVVGFGAIGAALRTSRRKVVFA